MKIPLTLTDNVYAELSCGTAIDAGDAGWLESSVTRNVGGIIKIYSDDNGFQLWTLPAKGQSLSRGRYFSQTDITASKSALYGYAELDTRFPSL